MKKEFKLSLIGETGTISYDVYKTEKSAMTLGKKIANEAFYGEEVEIKIEEIK